MPQTIRFHLDEHCSTALAEGLRRRGIDVTMTAEVRASGATDREQIALALNQSRVIFTQDDDFLALHAEGVKHAGIAYCHQEARSLGEIIQGRMALPEVLTLCHQSGSGVGAGLGQ
jgi:uncharacterized protein with PIN domain